MSGRTGSRPGWVRAEDAVLGGLLLAGVAAVAAAWAYTSAVPAHLDQSWTHVREDGFERVLADGDSSVTAWRRSGNLLVPVHLTSALGHASFATDVPAGQDEWAEGDRSSAWEPGSPFLAHLVVHVHDVASILPGTVPHLRKGDPPAHALTDPER